MTRFIFLVLCLAMISPAMAQQQVKEWAGMNFDGGAVFISSCAVRPSGSSTWSLTAPAINSTLGSYSPNLRWLVDNSEGEYDIMIDSCIWTDKGTKALLGVDMPYIIPKGQWRSLVGQCAVKPHMRILSTVKGWTTCYYLITY